MAGQSAVQTEVVRDRFGVLKEDPQRSAFELKWLEETATMSEDDFKAWLVQLAGEVEKRRPETLTIDMTRFGHRPSPEFPAWRDEQIIPRYNRAGLQKEAFLVPAGASGPMAAGRVPEMEPPGTFLVGYFDNRKELDAWLQS